MLNRPRIKGGNIKKKKKKKGGGGGKKKKRKRCNSGNGSMFPQGYL